MRARSFPPEHAATDPVIRLKSVLSRESGASLRSRTTQNSKRTVASHAATCKCADLGLNIGCGADPEQDSRAQPERFAGAASMPPTTVGSLVHGSSRSVARHQGSAAMPRDDQPIWPAAFRWQLRFESPFQYRHRSRRDRRRRVSTWRSAPSSRRGATDGLQLSAGGVQFCTNLRS